MERAVIDAGGWADGLRRLDLPPGAPVIAHASLSAFGPTAGGAATVVDALLRAFPAAIMPAFTYAVMVTPQVGPEYNGLTYGADDARNRLAKFFDPGMPADRLMGVIPETLRRRPEARRSLHPILSFVGVNADPYLNAQTLQDPLAPLQALLDAGGWALLLGVNHTVNTSIHLGERHAGRRAFIRWALTPAGVVACPEFPGCSDGFQALAPFVAGAARSVQLGAGCIQAIPLRAIVDSVKTLLQKDPLGLLCEQYYCERCLDTRRRLQLSTRSPRTFE